MSSPLKCPCLAVAAFLLLTPASTNAADVNLLRPRGRTLIEAESYSLTSKEYPHTEPCKKCSGGKNIGFFWKDSWLEIQVQVPLDGIFMLTARASSEDGANIAVLKSEETGSFTELSQIVVPKTRAWHRYTITEAVTLSLTQGVHTLRFRSLTDGANIDYFTFTSAAADTTDQFVTYRPAKTSGPDKNPLKGFGSGWWRANDEFATVGFQYIEWGQFEPGDDQFDWKYVEEVLSRDGTRGRHLILQFVVDWDYREPVEKNYLGPQWLLEKVGEHRGYATPDDKSSRPMRATKYNHPIYVEEATEAIIALANYFKEDPRVFILQAGLLGLWSEWHTFPREDWNPNDETKASLLNAYLSHLPRDCYTQIRYPNEPAVKPRPGIGYTNGSATPTEHGYAFGLAVERRELWKNGPITGEWPPNVEQDYWQRFFLTDEGEEFIQQACYSTLLMPEAKDIRKKLPRWTPDGRFLSMHRGMGYSLQIEQLRHVVIDSGIAHFELTLANSGIAPFYKDWEVQMAVLDMRGEVIEAMTLDTDLRQIAPGESVVLKTATRKAIDRGGAHQIGLRILQPGADEPKTDVWRLEPRNVYVVVANDVKVVPGNWGQDRALQGGWNLLGPLLPESSTGLFDSGSFPFRGSYRPADD